MANNKYKILIVEDDKNIRNFVSTLLTANGYQVFSAETCSLGIMMSLSHVPDLIILDLGLPDEDGTVFLETVRKRSNTPIIVLSARSDESDKVSALDLGANDYVTKPFSSAELLARVRSTLRNMKMSLNEENARQGKFYCDDLVIDYDLRKVTLSGEEIKLTQNEFNILALLSEHRGKVLTYSAIIKEIWGYSDHGSTKTLQVNMANIRKKFGSKPGEDGYIINELGVGYRIK